MQSLTILREAEKENYSVVFAGDICPKTIESQELIKNGGAKEIFSDVKNFFDSSDLRVAQWETTIGDLDTPIIKNGPNLQVIKECTSILNELNIDIALLANNHIGDYGTQGVLETIDFIQKENIKTVGAGKNLAEATKPLRINCGNIKISLINVAENEFGGAKDDKPGVSPLAVLKNIRQIKEEKSVSDLVFMAVHGGHETNPFPSPRMIETYRAFADAGANLVWNCHTHCPEGIEFYNDVPIVYSPGNFYFPNSNPTRALWHGGYLSKFLFDKKGVYGLEIMPYKQYQEKVSKLSKEKEEEFFEYLSFLSEKIAEPKEIQRYFEIWCTLLGIYYLGRHEVLKGMVSCDTDFGKEEILRLVVVARNLYTCESHNDLLRQTLLLMEENKIKERASHKDEILNIQELTWV